MSETEMSGELAAVPEGARDFFTDLLLEHWPRIAAAAWDGWLVHGRGTVTIEQGTVPPVLAYRPGAPCPCCAGRVEAYDPERQAVVAVVQDDGSVHLDRDAGRRAAARTHRCAPGERERRDGPLR